MDGDFLIDGEFLVVKCEHHSSDEECLVTSKASGAANDGQKIGQIGETILIGQLAQFVESRAGTEIETRNTTDSDAEVVTLLRTEQPLQLLEDCHPISSKTEKLNNSATLFEQTGGKSRDSQELSASPFVQIQQEKASEIHYLQQQVKNLQQENERCCHEGGFYLECICDRSQSQSRLPD